MNAQQSFHSNLSYGRELVKSGMAGLASGGEAQLHGQPLSQMLAQSARGSLGLAVLGACAGLLRYYLPPRRGRIANTLACGFVGCAIGFVTGFAWRTRKLTGSMTHSAVKSMSAVRDQHWLELHPIDYA